MSLYRRNNAAGYSSSEKYKDRCIWTEGIETYLIGVALAFVMKDIRLLEHKSLKIKYLPPRLVSNKNLNEGFLQFC
jgi:hypothetical protein